MIIPDHNHLILELEDLKVLRRSPDLINNVKIGQGQLPLMYLKPKVTLHCYYIYLFWLLVSGILNVFNSY